MKIATLFIAAVALAQNTMDAPSVGLMRDAWGVWRPVEGIAGNFVVGSPVDEPAQQPASPNTIEKRGEVFFIVSPDGTTLDALPSEARQPILMLGNTALYSTGDELVIGRARVACVGATTLRRMSAEWVQVSTATHEYALRIEPGREALYMLPAIPLPATPGPQERRR